MMDFALSPLKHTGGEVLNPSCLVCGPEGRVLSGLGGCKAVCWMCLLLCHSYPSTVLLKFRYLKVTRSPGQTLWRFGGEAEQGELLENSCPGAWSLFHKSFLRANLDGASS